MSLLIKRLLREGIDDKIVCDKCGWSWKKSESGPDMYFCHKCGHDNTPDNISENLQQADKIYFNTGKLPKDVRQTLIGITGGDAFTRLVADLIFHFSKHSKIGIDRGTIQLGEWFYQYLKEYDKNVFPVKYDLQAYSADANDNDKHVLELFAILKERHHLIQRFRQLPSIAVRNLKPLTKTVGTMEYVFKQLDDKLRELLRGLKTIPNSEKGQKVLNKIFNSRNDLDKMIEISNHYANAFTMGSDENREDLLEAIEMLNAEIIQNTDRLLVVKVNDQEAMQRIGCTSAWCFSLPNSEGYWESYAQLGYVYVIFDFDKDTEDATFLMVLLPDTNTVYASTNVPLEDIGIKDGYRYLKRIGVNLNKLNDEPQEEPAEEPEKKSKKSLKVPSNQLSLFERRKFIRESIRTRLMEQRIKYDIKIPSDILAIKDVFKKKGFKLYVVGGAVRDALLGKQPKDFDLATDALPDKVEEIMTKAGFRTLPTGKAFGVINVFTDQGEYEIATFREDIGSSDSRRPDSVKFTNIETDVKRRDLTINALFYDIDTKEIVDLVGGVNDLKNGVVRTVGKPEERFNEDRLRILRAIRFAGRFGSGLDPEVDAALQNDASLDGISGERIRDEFIKGIKSAKSTVQFLKLIDKYGLFDWIFKGLKINTDFVENHDPILVIATLLSENEPAVVNKQLNNLKYTIEEGRAITFLISLLKLTPETAVQLKRLQKNAGVTDAQISWFGSKMNIDSKLLKAFVVFKLTVSGDELMKQLNLKQGKELGDAINKAEYDNFKKLL